MELTAPGLSPGTERRDCCQGLQGSGLNSGPDPRHPALLETLCEPGWASRHSPRRPTLARVVLVWEELLSPAARPLIGRD